MAKCPGALHEIMAVIHRLFTGYESNIPLSTSIQIAVAKDGLVVYIEGLPDLSTNTESLRCINLVSGHIARPGDLKTHVAKQ